MVGISVRTRTQSGTFSVVANFAPLYAAETFEKLWCNVHVHAQRGAVVPSSHPGKSMKVHTLIATDISFLARSVWTHTDRPLSMTLRVSAIQKYVTRRWWQLFCVLIDANVERTAVFLHNGGAQAFSSWSLSRRGSRSASLWQLLSFPHDMFSPPRGPMTTRRRGNDRSVHQCSPMACLARLSAGFSSGEPRVLTVRGCVSGRLATMAVPRPWKRKRLKSDAGTATD